MTATVADQTPAERRSHLIDANQIRSDRARLKRELATLPRGQALVALVARIERWDPLILSCRLRQVVCCVDGYGPHTARKFAKYTDASQDDRLNDLSDAQLVSLVEGLRNPRKVMPHSHKAPL